MKNRKALVLIFSANLVSNFASGITFLAIPWYLVSLFGKEEGKLQNAAMMGAITLLMLFWGIYAGTLIDRYNRKRIFQIVFLIDFFLLSAVAIYGFVAQELPFPLIALVAGATLLSWSTYYPNLYAFAQELFEPKHYSLISSALELQGQVTNFLGMMIGGVLLAGSASISWWPEIFAMRPWHIWEIILMDAVTYLISFFLYSLIAYTPGAYKQLSQGGLFARIKQGFAYLKSEKPLLIFGIASHLVFFAMLVFVQVGMQVYVSDYLDYGFKEGARLLSEFEAVYSLGAVTSGLLGIALARKLGYGSLIQQLIFLTFLASGLFLTLAFVRSPSIFVIAAYFIGITNSGVRILRITYLIRIIPNHFIGRANSFFSVVNTTMRLLMILTLTLPFFSGTENGGNIVYGLMILGAVIFSGAVVMVVFFRRFPKA